MHAYIQHPTSHMSHASWDMLHVTCACTCTCKCVRVCEMQARYATDAPLDEFHCSNSILTVVKWLIEEGSTRARRRARACARARRT